MKGKLRITHGTAKGQERNIITLDRPLDPTASSDARYHIVRTDNPITFLKGLAFGLAIGAGVALTVAGVI